MIKPSDKFGELLNQFNGLEERVKSLEEKLADIEKDKKKRKN